MSVRLAVNTPTHHLMEPPVNLTPVTQQLRLSLKLENASYVLTILILTPMMPSIVNACPMPAQMMRLFEEMEDVF